MATFTLAQAHQRFKILYDKVDSFNSPEFTPEAIDELLNIGQDELIKAVTARGVEATQELADMLKNITTPFSTTTFNTGSNKEGGLLVQLPSDYYTALHEEAEITYTKCGVVTSERCPVYPVTRDRYNKIKYDPFNKPSTDAVLRLVYNNTSNTDTFELLVDSSVTLSTYYLDYIRRPLRIQYGSQYATVVPVPDVNCELVDKAYYRIIDIAVDKALEAMRLKQQQTANN
jgi:hypothetical protein